MKILTIGWISVFTSIAMMNVYIWSSYWNIPFINNRLPKLMIYLVTHFLLIFSTFNYFYLFFKGKTESKFSKILSYISGFYLTFLHYSIFLYIIHDLVYLTRGIIPYPNFIRILGDKMFFGGFLIFSFTALISVISLYNSNKLIVKNYNIEMNKKNSELESLNIVFISDGHIGTSVDRNNIDYVVDKIENLKPDILFLGGDFFDEGTTKNSKKISMNKLSKVNTKYGIYSIEGNHEYKSGDCNIHEEMSYFSDEEIIILQDEIKNIKEQFYIVGRKDDKKDKKDLDKLIDEIDKDLPIILLDHKPSYRESSKISNIELQLSGHTHNGQLFPMNLLDPILSKVTKQFNYGYHKINNLNHIVSSGIGNWGIPVRVGSRREIVNIKINFK